MNQSHDAERRKGGPRGDEPFGCAGCGLDDIHKRCPAHGTTLYMDSENPQYGNPIGVAYAQQARAEAAEAQLAEANQRTAAVERRMSQHIEDKHRILREYEAKLAEARAECERAEMSRDEAVTSCIAERAAREKAERERDAALERSAFWQGQYKVREVGLQARERELATLQAERDKLREALQRLADPENENTCTCSVIAAAALATKTGGDSCD